MGNSLSSRWRHTQRCVSRVACDSASVSRDVHNGQHNGDRGLWPYDDALSYPSYPSEA